MASPQSTGLRSRLRSLRDQIPANIHNRRASDTELDLAALETHIATKLPKLEEVLLNPNDLIDFASQNVDALIQMHLEYFRAVCEEMVRIPTNHTRRLEHLLDKAEDRMNVMCHVVRRHSEERVARMEARHRRTHETLEAMVDAGKMGPSFAVVGLGEVCADDEKRVGALMSERDKNLDLLTKGMDKVGRQFTKIVKKTVHESW